MRYFLGLALAVLAAAMALNVPPAWAERRLALSVGIDLYDNLPAHGQLKKAVNDARAIGEALAGLGFETAREENVTRQGFLSAWQRFLNRLQPGDTAALFFAGHGVEINGANYLVARDVPNVGRSGVGVRGSRRDNDALCLWRHDHQRSGQLPSRW